MDNKYEVYEPDEEILNYIKNPPVYDDDNIPVLSKNVELGHEKLLRLKRLLDK